MLSIKELVKDNKVYFESFHNGIFYYYINIEKQIEETDEQYQFQIPIEDIGSGMLLSEDKAITFMRWIRKSMENKTLIKKEN